MHRSMLFFAALVTALAAGCDVGDVRQSGPGGGGDDVGADASSDDGTDPDAAPAGDEPDAGDPDPVECRELIANVGSGEHNPGQPCLACHGPGGEDPTMTIGGTLYDALAGGNPVPGATIIVVDANGNEVDLEVMQNGNFYTGQNFAFPVQVAGSLCPNTLPMVTPVSASDGNCNQGGCHDSDFRIYLPAP